MPVALAETHDLVLDRRAITRAAAMDLPGIHRRTMHIGPNDLVRGRRRSGDAALDLPVLDALRSASKMAPAGHRQAAFPPPPSRSLRHRAAAACRSSAVRGSSPARSSVPESPSAGASPTRPAGICRSPIWMRPRRNVPVVNTTAPAPKTRPSASRTPATRLVDQEIVHLAFDHRRFGVVRIASCMAAA